MRPRRTLEDLRTEVRTGHPADRVRAAFALALQLKSAVVGELSLEDESHPGVRMHLLTVLASYGERAAVLAIAEHQPTEHEGEHAVYLAIQLGCAEPDWLADIFNRGRPTLRRALLRAHADRVHWASTVHTLEHLLEDDFDDVRHLASLRLLALSLTPTPALKRFALTDPEGGRDVFTRWAATEAHLSLMQALPELLGRTAVGLNALVTAGRTYPLRSMEDVLLQVPEAFRLVRRPCSRAELFALTARALDDGRWLSEAWMAEFEARCCSPWDPRELAVLNAWRASLELEGDGSESWDDWVVDSQHLELLRAVGFIGEQQLPTRL